eukprot:scaffold72962_cov56-Phaeocystis_antarctica.AAC.2
MGGRERDGRMHAPLRIASIFGQTRGPSQLALETCESQSVLGLYAPRLRRPRRGGKRMECDISKPNRNVIAEKRNPISRFSD